MDSLPLRIWAVQYASLHVKPPILAIGAIRWCVKSSELYMYAAFYPAVLLFSAPDFPKFNETMQVTAIYVTLNAYEYFLLKSDMSVSDHAFTYLLYFI